MRVERLERRTGALTVALLVAATLGAQETVPALKDLLGARSAGAETALTTRGYIFVGIGPGAKHEFAYWREPTTKRCVGVRHVQAHVKAVVYAPDAECDAAAANKPKAPAPSKTGFHTVCGVTVDGQEYRFKCTVEGAAPGGPGQTVLHFPDNVVTIKWENATAATATFAGMKPMNITVTTADGVTRFAFENKPYFYVSDRKAAAAQLETLR